MSWLDPVKITLGVVQIGAEIKGEKDFGQSS